MVMASDRNHPERSSIERQYLPVIGATLPLERRKDLRGQDWTCF